MRFADSQYLWLMLLLIPVALIFIADFFRQRKKIADIGDAQLVKSMITGYSWRRDAVKRVLLLVILALLVVIIARPQMGTRVSNEKRNGIEVVVAIDVSNSMLATDVAPSRLEKTKMLVSNMIDHFSEDKLGIVVFAGDAFVQLPITNDFVSAKMFLQSISPALISTQGTDIARAITLSSASFTQAEGIGKAIIIVTDGEDHEGGATEAAQKASGRGYNIVVMGVGSTKGSPIKMADGDYLKDNTGNVVMTALNEQMCQEVATAGKGLYIHVDNTSSAQDQLDDFLSRLQRGETENVSYSEYAEQTPWIALIIVILLIIEALLVRKEGVIFSRIKQFLSRIAAPHAAPLLLLFILATASAGAQTKDRMHIKNGNRHFRSGLYDKALADYQKAVAANSQNPQALYNYGCALLMQNQDSSAIEYFQAASKIEKNKFRLSKSYHNIGFICQRHQMYGEAIEAYKESLRLNPTDDETRYNLALCQRNKQQQGGGQSDSNNDDKQQGNDKQQNTENDKNSDADKQNKPQQRSSISKDNAERLLNAAMQQERATQKKIKDAQRQGSRHLDKNW